MKKKRKNPAAVALAKRRSACLSPERRSEIARKAAQAKWEKVGTDPAARKKAVSEANKARRKS